MSIYTHQHAFALNAEGGRFVARYTVMVDGGHVADNQLTIENGLLQNLNIVA